MTSRVPNSLQMFLKNGLSHVSLIATMLFGFRKNFTRDQFGVSRSDLFRLSKEPRFTRTYLALLNKRMELTDSEADLVMYSEIFRHHTYRFVSDKESPFIIDCGSNIGMSVLYFKWLYPESEILAFEPDPHIFSVLKRNIETYQLKHVNAQPYAIWNKEAMISFKSDGGVGGMIADQLDLPDLLTIRSVRLKDFLNRDIDFLKIDIEGVELDVIVDCKKELAHVKNLFIEYHGKRHEMQKLHLLLGILSEEGFHYYLEDAMQIPQPFVNKFITDYAFDLQVNVFAWKQ